MKKIALLLMTMALVVACNSNEPTHEDQVRRIAERDIIEKLELPEGTEFNDETIEVSTKSGNADIPGVHYVVKVTVKSQNREGKEITKSYTMNYKTKEDAESAKDRFELISFE